MIQFWTIFWEFLGLWSANNLVVKIHKYKLKIWKTIGFNFSFAVLSKKARSLIATGFERTTTYFANEHSSIQTGLTGPYVQTVCLKNSCGMEFQCNHLNFRFRTSFEHRVLWHSVNYRVYILLWNAHVTWQEHIKVWF